MAVADAAQDSKAKQPPEVKMINRMPCGVIRGAVVGWLGRLAR